MSILIKRLPIAVWIFALFIAVVTSAPYFIGLLNTPVGWQYSGIPTTPTGLQIDYPSHFAKMWQGSRGEWNYHLLFTHEYHSGLPLLQGFYVALGALAHISSFSLPLVFHIARFLLTIGMVLAIWVFACRFFEKESERWLGLLFGTVAVGLSWVLLFFSRDMTEGTAPIEFWLADAFNVLGAFYLPHFAAAVILQIVIVLTFDDWVRRGGQWRLAMLTLALAAESIVQPYSVLLLLPLLFVLTMYHVFSAKRLSIRRALWLSVPFTMYALLVLYQYAALNSDPVWASFTAQNQTLSPDVIYYLLGYLPFIFPMAVGLPAFLVGEADDRWWLPIIWVGLVAMLLYAPFPTQRRYLLGVQSPLAIMAAFGWARAILPRFSMSRRNLITIVYLSLASIALVGMLVVNSIGLSKPESNQSVFYQPDELKGFEWLRQQGNPNDIILSTFELDGRGSGGRIVAMTGERVFIGHWIETANFAEKLEKVRQFYNSDTTDQWRLDFLKDINAVYVWYDDSARRFGDWNPAGVDYLDEVFSLGTVSIFKVG